MEMAGRYSHIGLKTPKRLDR